MADHTAHHPLDVDLLDFAESAAGAARATATDPAPPIEAHLADCVICRIKVQRLRDAGPVPLVPLGDVTVPAFSALEVQEAAGESARPGELWLTAADDAAIVLVQSLRGGGTGVSVVPVVTDVEVADSGARVLDAAASPVGVPVAIYDRLVATVPPAALAGRIVPTRDVDLLALTDGDPGVSRGSALEGGADPRHEVRQHLVDRLAGLGADPPEGSLSTPATAAEQVAALRDGLAVYRGDWCFVEALDRLPDLPGRPPGWTGVASVSEFGVRVVVVGTPSGLVDRADFVAAQALLFRLHASAIVVANSVGDTVDLYDPPTLFEGFELPAGERSTYPLIEGLPAVDAVAKFLEQKSRSAAVLGGPRARAGAVAVDQVLVDKGVEAVADAVARAGRLGDEKRQGVLRLDQVSADLAEALKAALRPDFDVAAVTGVLEQGVLEQGVEPGDR
jgi:hypothetical protein